MKKKIYMHKLNNTVFVLFTLPSGVPQGLTELFKVQTENVV